MDFACTRACGASPTWYLRCVVGRIKKMKKILALSNTFLVPSLSPVRTIFTVTHFGRVIELVVIINTLIFFLLCAGNAKGAAAAPVRLRFFTVVFCDWIRFRIISTSLPSTQEAFPFVKPRPSRLSARALEKSATKEPFVLVRAGVARSCYSADV